MRKLLFLTAIAFATPSYAEGLPLTPAFVDKAIDCMMLGETVAMSYIYSPESAERYANHANSIIMNEALPKATKLYYLRAIRVNQFARIYENQNLDVYNITDENSEFHAFVARADAEALAFMGLCLLAEFPSP